MSDHREKIIDRVRKLHAMAESAKEIGSQHEAESFATAVQQMLEKYKIEMTEVELAAQDKDDPMGHEWVDFHAYGIPQKMRRAGWSELLANIVAHAHYCAALINPKTNGVMFVGRSSDRKLAEYMFAYLYRTCNTLADKAYNDFFYGLRGRGEDVTRARGFRASWVNGFITVIGQRYRDRHVAHSTALVRARHEVEEYKNAMQTKQVKAKGINANNINGALAGAEAGSKVNLDPTALEGGVTNTRQRRLNG